MMIEIGKVKNSTPGIIQIQLNSTNDFERNKEKIKISRYLSIEDGNDIKILASIQNISAIQSSDGETISYTVSCSPIGSYCEIDNEIKFKQGGVNLPSPTEPAYIPDDNTINSIFCSNENFSFHIGHLKLKTKIHPAKRRSKLNKIPTGNALF